MLRYLIRTLLFSCLTFTAMSVAGILQTHFPDVLPLYTAGIVGLIAAYIVTLMEISNDPE